MEPHDTPPLPPGTRIGWDVVEGVLGRGSFATVYRMRSPEGYVSALKLLPLEEGGRSERVWREVSLGTRLHHPNLSCQLGMGKWPEDNPRFLWVKLRLITGPTLQEWGHAPGRTVGEVVDRMVEVARGLAVAHDARVVHRDVKEDNILVDARTGQAVLVDFGAGYHEDDPTLTKGVFPTGAHLYRAPETWAFLRQHAGVEGAHYRAGPSGDLYALGVVFYQLLTGRAPFHITDEGRVDVEAVLNQAPLPPSLVNPRVPPEVEAVCLRLLAKTPEARYPSAVALYEALKEAKARADATWHEPLRGSTPPAARAPWTRRARMLAGVGVGVGLALALGAWWLTSRQEVAPEGPSPDAARAVAAPPQASPPTVAASPAAPRKDPDFMKQPRTSAPQPEAPSFDLEALLRKLCLGLGGTVLQACVAAHPQVPPERPEPPPQQCPAGAVEAMTALGLRLGDTKSVTWSDVQGRAIPVREDSPVFLFGNWRAGADSWGMGGTHVALPHNTRLSGRLHFGQERVYGRFTEARTPTGETYPVCLELTYADKVGEKLSTRSEPGKPMVAPSSEVRVVDRFQ
jgi:serine/threonine-protein kinase